MSQGTFQIPWWRPQRDLQQRGGLCRGQMPSGSHLSSLVGGSAWVAELMHFPKVPLDIWSDTEAGKGRG